MKTIVKNLNQNRRHTAAVVIAAPIALGAVADLVAVAVAAWSLWVGLFALLGHLIQALGFLLAAVAVRTVVVTADRSTVKNVLRKVVWVFHPRRLSKLEADPGDHRSADDRGEQRTLRAVGK